MANNKHIHVVTTVCDPSDGERTVRCSCGFTQNMGRVSAQEAIKMAEGHKPPAPMGSSIEKMGFASGLPVRSW